MENHKYKSTVRGLGVSIFLLELAMAGAALLLVFTLQDSVRILSIVGLWDDDFGGNLWWVWPIVSLSIAAVAWSEFVFVPRAKALFADDAVPIEKFGASMKDEAKSLADVRMALNKYAIFLIATSLAIGMFIGVGFVNVLLVCILIALQFGLLMLFREKAKMLKADEVLLK